MPGDGECRKGEPASELRPWLPRVRHGGSLIMLTLGLFFAGFWLRSYDCRDSLFARLGGRLIYFHTVRGGVTLRVDEDPAANRRSFRPPALDPDMARFLIPPEPVKPRWGWRIMPNEHLVFLSPPSGREILKRRLGFAIDSDPVLGWRLALPYWFHTLVCVVAAALLAPPPRWRFSIRRLLAVVTLAAVVLGLVISLPTGRE